MINDLNEKYKVRGAIQPPQEMYAVFYDDKLNDIFTHKILWFEIQQTKENVVNAPVIFLQNTRLPEAIFGYVNFLSVSYDYNPSKEDFKGMIEFYKKYSNHEGLKLYKND